jgi:phosphonoacetate hydrolase
VLADAGSVLGTRAAEHDLSGLDRPLRSHGSAHEQAVPFITNFDLAAEFTRGPLRNFDAFAAALNRPVPH